MANTSIAQPAAWYRALDRRQWNTLLAANLGWLFDGYETYALILVIGAALRQLLEPALVPRLPAYAGIVIAVTLFGWGLGGLLGGILADYIGRKRTMILAIIAYSLTTGLSALSFDWVSFAVLRFLVGIAIGSEWATGSSMMAELWPAGVRGRGAGVMQCGLGIGFFLASLVWLVMAPVGPNAWRYMFLIGILPALLTLWIRRQIPESDLWQQTSRLRQAARERLQRGIALEAQERMLTRFTLVGLFSEAEVRRRTIVALLMALGTGLAWWGISTWIPPYIGSVAAAQGLSAPRWAGLTGLSYNLGGIAGYVAFGFLADAIGRKPVALLFYALSLLMTPVLFLWTHDLGLLLVVACINGFFTLGQYSWMPVWLPELFPTRLRATGIAFAFNVPRFIIFLGPLVSGALIAHFGGFRQAAIIFGLIYLLGLAATPFLPETRGKPLPETV